MNKKSRYRNMCIKILTNYMNKQILEGKNIKHKMKD